MKNTRLTNLNTHRDAWVEINLDSIAHNIGEFRSKIPSNIKILGIVKADAYGHGASMVVPIMLASGIDMLGVASIDEGLDLRKEKIDCDILVVGAVPVWSFDIAVENNIELSIFSEKHIEACKTAYERTGIRPKVHIKLDTGMNRIGLCSDDAVSFIKKVQSLDFIELKGIFTHLANAEDTEKTKKQFECWKTIISQINTDNLLLHILNTAGSITNYNEQDLEYNMVRMGIAIYGLYPDLAKDLIFYPKLKQAIGLKGRITNIHTMQKGEGISYGYSYIADKPTKIATIPIGYADGVPRGLSNKIYGELNGTKIKQVGNITMDQMMFDITGIDATEGDIITLLNDKDLTIDNWANLINTINYELTCRLKVRLPRIYVR